MFWFAEDWAPHPAVLRLCIVSVTDRISGDRTDGVVTLGILRRDPFSDRDAAGVMQLTDRDGDGGTGVRIDPEPDRNGRGGVEEIDPGKQWELGTNNISSFPLYRILGCVFERGARTGRDG